MGFWIYAFMLTYHCFCHASPIVKSSLNSSIYKILDRTNSVNLSRFVAISSMLNQNVEDILNVEFKTLKSRLSIQPISEWHLSVHVNEQFFNNNHTNQIIHVLCYLQFSIENSSRFVGSQTNCATLLNWSHQNKSQSASCEIKIGRSPSFCSTSFDVSGLNFNNSPIWGSINAQLFLASNSLLATSVNSMPVVFNHQKPVNWTVVQQDENFGQLSLGLPITSVKTGSHFLLPISITDIDDISHMKMLFDYDRCLSLNTIELTDNNHWFLKTNFERSDNGVNGVIKLNSKKNQRSNTNTSVDWPIILVLNFTIVDKQSSTAICTIRAGISKVDLNSTGGGTTYFTKADFHSHQKSVAIAIDPDMMDIISFKEPQTQKKTVDLFMTDNGYSFNIATYLIQHLGERYLPQLIKMSPCSDTNCAGYSPQTSSNSWNLPITIEHWRTVLYNLENKWHPDLWMIHMSDTELNPVSDWRVPQNRTIGNVAKCIPLYQSARISVAVKLASFNSMGLKTYLGASIDQPRPWIDVTNMVRVSFDPPDVAILSTSMSGATLVNVNKDGPTTIRAHGPRGKVLASREIAVYKNHWASVMAIKGRCVSHISVRVADNHPASESDFINVDVISGDDGANSKCHLLLTAVFNDGSVMELADIDSAWYMLEVDGVRIENGDLIERRDTVTAVLFESVWCGNSRQVIQSVVNLRKGEPNTNPTVSQSEISGNKISQSAINSNGNENNRIQSAAYSKKLMMNTLYVFGGLISLAVVIISVTCIIKRHSLFQARKSRHVETGLGKHGLESLNDHYPSLLPPPGPILHSNKQHTEWGSSSESGLGSQTSHIDPVGMTTFRCSVPNGSLPNSESSSFIRQTSPISDPIIDSISNSSLLFDPRKSSHGSYWPLATSVSHHPSLCLSDQV